MGKIYEFDPVIYPFKLWVTRSSTTIDEIDRVFEAINDDGFGVPFKSVYHNMLDYGTDATTIIVGHTKQGLKGCLVVLSSKVAVKTLSHEADHCADYLFEEIGDTERTYAHGEPYAYYQSWVFDCLYKVKNKRI